MAKVLIPFLLMFILLSCNGAAKKQAQQKFQDSVDKAETEKYYSDKEKERQKSIDYSKNYKAPEKKKNLSKAKISRVEYRENKTKGYKIRWITYYVENYTDDKDTYEKMKDVAYEITKNDVKDVTNIFFFKNRKNIPPLAKDGKGWAAGYSQNDFNYTYGKDCIGWYYKESRSMGELSKSWN